MNVTTKSVSQLTAVTTKAKFKLLLIYLVPVLVVSPSFVWITLDKTVWTWDPALYGKGSVELFYTLVHSPQKWLPLMLDILHQQAPGLAWFGQFFVPLGYVLNSIDVGLLLFVVLIQALTLILMHRSILELSGSSAFIAVTGCMVLASAPLFVGLSHLYFVEPMQTLAIAWFILIMSFAPKWGRTFILGQLLVATAFAMLAKVSSPLYCLGPGLVALNYAFHPRKSAQLSAQSPKKYAVTVTLIIGILLDLLVAAWYHRNITYVVQHVSVASSGPVAALYGKKDLFLNTLLFWLRAVQNSFFLPSVLIVSSLIFASGVIYYFIRPKALKYHTICTVIAILQILTVLVVFSLSSNRDPRYLLPTLPYFSLLVGWSLAQINRPILVGLTIAIFTFQLTVVYGQALGVLKQIPTISHWLIPVNGHTKHVATLNSLVSRTCLKEGNERYWNIVGVEKPWLNQNSVSYFAAKNLAPRNLLGCYYGSVYSYLVSDPNEIWKHILSLKIHYYVTVDPDFYPLPSDTYNQAINQNYLSMLHKVQMSNLFEPEPLLPEDPGILIFRRKEFDAAFSFGNIVTLLDKQLSGDLLASSLRVQAKLTWQVLQPLDQPYTIDLRIVDAHGQLLAQQQNQVFTAGLQPGEQVTGPYDLTITGSRPASANLEVRLLDAAEQEVPLQDGTEAIIIPQVQNEVNWQIKAQ